MPFLDNCGDLYCICSRVHSVYILNCFRCVINRYCDLHVAHQLAAVVVMYSPADVQKAIYPYLVTIYAFLISALISLVQSNLTRNDAVFVLVAVASPATLYLWIMFLFAAIFHQTSPWALATGTNKISQRFLFVTVLGSLIMWLTMLGIIVGSPSGVSFSQQACSKEYGRKALSTMIWPSGSLAQMLCLIFSLNIAVLVRRLGLTKDRTVL